jgi:hypothetical protein
MTHIARVVAVRTDRPEGCEKAFPAAEMDSWLEWDGVRVVAEVTQRQKACDAPKL